MKLFFTNALILTSFFSFCQDDNFLKNYKAPNYKLTKLDIGFNSKGSSNVNYNYFNNKIKANYFHLANNSRRQSKLSLLSDYSYSISTKTSVPSTKNTHSSLSLKSQFENRFYLRPNFFIGLHGTVNFHSYSQVKIDTTTSKIDGVFTHFNPTFSFGFGRVEPVRYAQSALNVQNSLKKANVIGNDLSEQEIHLISNEIAKMKNKRFFDNRLQIIYEIEKMDSLLNEMGIMTHKDIRYYTLMSDALLYSLITSRYSGMRHEIGFGDAKNKPNFDLVDNVGLSMNYTFSYFNPISNQLQGDSRAGITTVLNGNLEVSINLDGGYEFGYYPNTRTYMSVKLNSGVNLINVNENFIALGGRIHYYLSPRFRVHGNAEIINSTNYDFYNISYAGVDKPYLYGTIHRYRFNLGLNYAIF